MKNVMKAMATMVALAVMMVINLGSPEKAEALLLKQGCGGAGQPACITVALSGTSGNPGGIDWSVVLLGDGTPDLVMTTFDEMGVKMESLDLGSLASLGGISQILFTGFGTSAQVATLKMSVSSENLGVEYAPLWNHSTTPYVLTLPGNLDIGLDAAPVPEPSTIILLGAGFAGLAAARIRKRYKASAK